MITSAGDVCACSHAMFQSSMQLKRLSNHFLCGWKV